MTSPLFDQQIIDAMAKSIAKYQIHYIHEHAESTRLLSFEMAQKLLRDIQHRRTLFRDAYVLTDEEILQKAQEKAVLLCQEAGPAPAVASDTSNLKSSTKSVSLFQTSGEKTMDNLLTFELIRERAENSHEILDMLLKVRFIDDIIPDWDEIALFLHSELSVWLSNAESTDPCCFLDFIALHRQWFDMTRKGIHSCQDYQMIQISLAKSLVESVRTVNSLNVDIQLHLDFYRQCVCTILDMFCDWMDRNIGGTMFQDPAIRQIGTTLWDWCTFAPKCANDRSALLRRHRPLGQWIYQWFTQCFTVEELVLLLERSTPDLSSACETAIAYNALYLMVLEARTQISVINRIKHPSNAAVNFDELPSDLVDAVWNVVWLLSTIRSILCVTRLSRFPCYLLECSTKDGTFERSTVDPHECHMQMWGLFWQMFLWIQQKCPSSMKSSLDMDSMCVVCTDAMDILLRGVPSFTQSIMLSDIIDQNEQELVHLLKLRSCDM